MRLNRCVRTIAHRSYGYRVSLSEAQDMQERLQNTKRSLGHSSQEKYVVISCLTRDWGANYPDTSYERAYQESVEGNDPTASQRVDGASQKACLTLTRSNAGITSAARKRVSFLVDIPCSTAFSG
jgi:hypothetical protein